MLVNRAATSHLPPASGFEAHPTRSRRRRKPRGGAAAGEYNTARVTTAPAPHTVRLAGRPVFYGWIVLAALGITETVTWGIVYYGFPVFLQAMERDLGASRVAVTGALSIGLGVSALAAVPVGRWIDRHGPRALMTAGSVLATVLTLAWSQVESLVALYAVWVLMGFALAATLYEPAFAAVVSWFVRGRDRALLVLTLVAGLASTIFMPIEAWLMAWLGWRGALLTLATVLGVVTIPLHALVLRRGPGSGPGAAGAARAAGEPVSLTLHAAAGTVVFWVLFVAYIVSNFATTSISTHMIPYLSGHGYSASLAAATVGWMGAMQLPGRLLFVPIARRIGARWVTAVVFLGQAVGIGQLPFLGRLGTVVPVVVVLGASNGMSTLARATSLAEIFGPRNYGAISGAVALGANGARAAGPVGASLLLLALGGYTQVFWALGVALTLAAAAVLATDDRARREE
jgi:MFS family permease